MKRLWLFCLFLSIFCLRAQNPGGIPGHTLWLEAKNYNASTKIKEKRTLQEEELIHFNFNPVLDVDQSGKSLFKNIVKERFSLFIVFKSDIEDELPVLTLKKGRKNLYLTNKVLLGDNEAEYKKVDSKKGILLSYLSTTNDKAGKRNNSIKIEDFFTKDPEGKQQLLEVIYYPRILNDLEREKVETYLSLKYGLSILGEFNYLDGEGEKIWDAKENIGFNSRITGIGRDDKLNLYQKQSGNSLKDGLYMGLGIIDTTNAKNKSSVDDRTFLLWGDNNGSTAFGINKDNKTIKGMNRTWKLRSVSGNFQDSLATQLRISKTQMPSIAKDATLEDEYLWLAINDQPGVEFDYSQARYLRQAGEDDEFIYFDDVIWDNDKSGYDSFTLVKGPDFFFKYASQIPDCDIANDGKVKINIAGGSAPYSISLMSGDMNQSITTTARDYEFEGLRSGEYTLIIKDSRNRNQKETFIVEPFATIDITMAPVWYLDKNNETLIMPVFTKGTGSSLSYEWKNEQETLSKDKQITVKDTGDYILKISNEQGCSKEFPFKVEARAGQLASYWNLYPNPVKKGEPFVINFNLEHENNIAIQINSLDGKQIKSTGLRNVKELQHSEMLEVSGIYLVTITIGNTAETLKLIVE